MTIKASHIASLMMLLAGWAMQAESVQAQYIHFSMSVTPELSTEVIQNLDFGTYTINSGVKSIEMGHPNMGIFQIRALSNQHLIVTLNAPDYLLHEERSVDSRIPLRLQASYTNNGIRDVERSKRMVNNQAWFPIGDQRPNGSSWDWETAYIYIYGQVEIGDVVQGDYVGQLVLNVEYY